MAELPKAISVEHQLLVRSLLAGRFESAVTHQFAAVTKEVFFPAGKIIYAEGARSDSIYFLLEGRIELSTEGEEPWYLGGRAVFGVLDVEIERDRDRTARAVTDVRAMRIDAGDWLDLIEDNFELTPSRIRTIAGGLVRLGMSLDPPGGFDDGPVTVTAVAESFAAEERPSLMPPSPGQDGRELNPFERLITLRLCPSLARAGTQSLIRLSRAARPRIYAAGERIALQGAVSESFHVVVSGSVLARRDDPALEVSFAAPQLAGGYAGFGQERWEVALLAAVDSCTLEIRYDDLYDVMEDHFDMVRAVMAFLAGERDRLQRRQAPR
jgi:CRP-like cAMP-binding protein